MLKNIFVGMLVIGCMSIMPSFADGRPCNKQELAIHKMFSQNSTCYQPDLHPLPYGIVYPKGNNLPDSAVYFINLTGIQLKISETQYLPDVDGGGTFSDILVTLPTKTYTLVYPLGGESNDEYIFTANEQEIKFVVAYPRNNDEPVIYKYIIFSISHGKLYSTEVSEKHAVKLLKNMKYVR